MTKSETEHLLPSSQINYAIPIENDLHNRIEKLIKLLNHSDDKKHTKQSWILDAFVKKLQKEEEPGPEISQNKHLRFAINQHLYEKIENKIKTVKKTRKGYTKNQWFIDAVNEKLEQDERRAKKLLLKLKSLSSAKKA